MSFLIGYQKRFFIRLIGLWIILCSLFLGIVHAQNRIWQPNLMHIDDWQRLAKPERDAQFLKFIIDIKTNKIYYIDANVFPLHIDFGLNILLKKPRTPEHVKTFNLNYGRHKPQFILGYLTHYSKINLWTVSFWEGDAIAPNDVTKTFQILKKTFFEKKLIYRPDSVRQEKMAQKLNPYGIPTITNDKIYQNLPFTAFQVGHAVGLLRIVPANHPIESLYFEPHDIVVLQKAYPDISPVAGIITTTFSTPLAHVNLRASGWGIPNAAYKKALSEWAALDRQWVYYQVTEQGISLRLATPAEIAAIQHQKNTQKTITLPKANTIIQTLQPLHALHAHDVFVYGAKTANLGEMARQRIPSLWIPDGFGIPFYYYQAHLERHHLQAPIEQMLQDPRFKSDNLWRRNQLLAMQQAIQDAPIASEHLQRMVIQWQKQLGKQSVFVRSSTNAEDLKGFQGAGLYDTVPNVKTPEAFEQAIKKVWASIWNERAVNERTWAGLDHRQVFPAVLIQIGIQATAAGVLLTTDIWAHNPHTYTINAKWGLGMRVVEGQKIPEQVLYDAQNHGTRIISRSNETTMLVFDTKQGLREVPTPAGDTILTEARSKRLGDIVKKIIPLFSQDTPLDIEWVLEGETFWIVQARPYSIYRPIPIKH